MSFRPNPNDKLTINGVTYRVAEHPSAPGMPYGQEGRAGIVYKLQAGGKASALKVFKPRFRLPYLVSQSERIAVHADLSGLQVCRRTVLSPSRHVDLLRQYPDLTYAVLMPWIEGPTWLEVVLEKKPYSREQSLTLARALTETLVRMEEQGIAHCDLSGPNVILPVLAGQEGLELVDVEGMYAPGLPQPEALSSGSAGYAHKAIKDRVWNPKADRFAGAVLLAEMLGWCDPQVTQAAWGESYFEPGETQQNGKRYQTLLTSLRRHWGDGVADLFERTWQSDSLSDCPTFGEWLVVLPVSSEQRVVSSEQAGSSLPPIEKKASESELSGIQEAEDSTPEKVESVREVRAFMQAARRMEERGNLERAIETYRQAQELAASDSALGSLANEIKLTLRDVEVRRRGMAGSALPQAYPTSRELAVESQSLARTRQADGTGVEGKNEGSLLRYWPLALIGILVVGALSIGLFAALFPRPRATPALETPAPAFTQPPVITESPTEAPVATITPIATPLGGGTGKLAFYSYREGNDEIYLVNYDGSELIRLTYNDSLDKSPKWSIDGSTIAFSSYRDSWDIWTMNPDGSNQKQLTFTDTEKYPESWSPDGTQLAYADLSGTRDIYLINVDNLQQTRLTNDPGWDACADFYPDGKKMLFVSDRSGMFEIYTLELISKAITKLTSGANTLFCPHWSPDGRKIVFSANEDIYLMNTDGTNWIRLTTSDANDWNPIWSPDGKWIAFSSDQDGNNEIYIMKTDGTDQTRLTFSPENDEGAMWQP